MADPIRIPILRLGTLPDARYLEVLKRAIHSDGCSDSPDIYKGCCVEHDLAYGFGIDCYGRPMDKGGADTMLRECMQRRSPLGRYSPVSWLYWTGVHVFGWKAAYQDEAKRPPFDVYLFN